MTLEHAEILEADTAQTEFLKKDRLEIRDIKNPFKFYKTDVPP